MSNNIEDRIRYLVDTIISNAPMSEKDLEIISFKQSEEIFLDWFEKNFNKINFNSGNTISVKTTLEIVELAYKNNVHINIEFANVLDALLNKYFNGKITAEFDTLTYDIVFSLN